MPIVSIARLRSTWRRRSSASIHARRGATVESFPSDLTAAALFSDAQKWATDVPPPRFEALLRVMSQPVFAISNPPPMTMRSMTKGNDEPVHVRLGEHFCDTGTPQARPRRLLSAGIVRIIEPIDHPLPCFVRSRSAVVV